MNGAAAVPASRAAICSPTCFPLGGQSIRPLLDPTSPPFSPPPSLSRPLIRLFTSWLLGLSKAWLLSVLVWNLRESSSLKVVPRTLCTSAQKNF